VRRVLVIELLLNLVVASVKGAYGLWSGSLVIVSDALHSLSDAGANILGLLVVRASQAPPDSGHPYGHRKFESVAAAALGIFITGIGINLAFRGVSGLVSGREPPQPDVLGLVVICGTFTINVFVALYERREARRLSSHFLAADAAHTATDVLVTTVVLVAFGAAGFGIDWAESAGTIAISFVVMGVGWRVIADNLLTLVDAATLDAARVVQVATSVPGVRGCHRVRSHGTKSEAVVDLHLQFDADLPLRDAHILAHEAEKALREALPTIIDVTIHMEPADDPEESL